MDIVIQPSSQSIAEAWQLLFEPQQTVELRAINAADEIRWGRYNSGEALAAAVVELQAMGFNCYWTLNPLSDNAPCSWRSGRGAAADADIVRRRWLLVDVDCKTKPASDVDLSAAQRTAADAAAWLQQKGWPEPTVSVCTGNGYHILYRCDLPNTAKVTFAVNNWLNALSAECDNKQCRVDTTVGNPARIARIPGGVNLKAGRIVTVQDSRSDVQPIAAALLHAYAAGYVERTSEDNGDGNGFDLQQWLGDVNAPLKHPEPKTLSDGSRLWEFTHDPVSGRTDDTTAYVLQRADGGIAAGSHHDSPESQWGWADLRAKLEPAVTLDLSSIPMVEDATQQQQPQVIVTPQFGPLQPLPETQPPVQTLSADMLPTFLSDFVYDVAERSGCPPEYPAAFALGTLGAALGNRIVVQPKVLDTGWLEVANLWVALVGQPGDQKSPARRAMVFPLRDLDKQYRDEAKAKDLQQSGEYRVLENKLIALDSQVKSAVKKGEALDEKDYARQMTEINGKLAQRPPKRRCYTSDPTVEALQMTLADNPSGMMVDCDELMGLLVRLERPENASLRSFLLTAWAGMESFSQERITRKGAQIDRCCVSIVGGLTPETLHGIIRRAANYGSGGDGLLQRFSLLVYPDKLAADSVDRQPDQSALQKYREAVLKMQSDAIIQDSRASGPLFPTLRFSQTSADLFDTWIKLQLNPTLRDETVSHLVRSHLAKHKTLIAGLSLILHLAEGRSGDIQPDTVQTAIRWSGFCETHARRAYGAVDVHLTAVRTVGLRLLSRRIGWDAEAQQPKPFSLRELYRRHWSGVTTQHEAEDVAAALEELGWLVVESRKTGGRPSVVCHPSPAIWQQQKK